jgi:hypothetical protein
LEVALDPRVHATVADLAEQWNLAHKITAAMQASYNAYNDYAVLQSAIAARVIALKDSPQAKETVEALAKLQKSAEAVGEGVGESLGIGPMNRDISRYFIMVESADIRPPASARKAALDACVGLQKNLETWRMLNEEDVAGMNRFLGNMKMESLPVSNLKQVLTCE